MVEAAEVAQLLLEPLARPLRGQREQRLHREVVRRDEVQVQVGRVALLLHRRDEVAHLLLVLLQLTPVHPGALERVLDARVRVEEVKHQLQGVAVQVHVEPVLTEDEEHRGGAQRQTRVLRGVAQLAEELGHGA